MTVEYDPNKDVSGPLTEVRTVLSRAETALETLVTGGTVLRWDGKQQWTNGQWDRGTPIDHPDGDEMVAALRQAVVLLSPWRKTGSVKRKSLIPN